VYNLGLYGVVAGLLGARLGYVLQYWSVYQNDLGAIFALNFNTLSPIAGLLAALAVAYGYARRKGIANRRLLDALTPGLVVFAAGLALADLASGDGYGAPAQLPWSINLWGELRHPAQIYHLLAAIGIGIVVWRAFRIATIAKDPFGTYLAAGIASMLALQMFVNVGMTIGIMPITGITLPFVSYGGSSLLTNAIAVGLLLNVHMRRFT